MFQQHAYQHGGAASIHRSSGLQQKSFVHDKNIYIDHRAPQITYYVKNNRYMPLYRAIYGGFGLIWGYIPCFPWLWVGMVRYGYLSFCFPLYSMLSIQLCLLSIYSMLIIICYCISLILLPQAQSLPGIFFIQVESIYKDKKKISYILIN